VDGDHLSLLNVYHAYKQSEFIVYLFLYVFPLILMYIRMDVEMYLLCKKRERMVIEEIDLLKSFCLFVGNDDPQWCWDNFIQYRSMKSGSSAHWRVEYVLPQLYLLMFIRA
jgi:hypothetical protein